MKYNKPTRKDIKRQDKYRKQNPPLTTKEYLEFLKRKKMEV
jgi:hypothetical protein